MERGIGQLGIGLIGGGFMGRCHATNAGAKSAKWKLGIFITHSGKRK